MGNLAVTAASVKPGANANLLRGIAAVAIEAGETVYRLADGTIGLADANGATPADTPAGIACCSALQAGQPVVFTDDDDDFTPGATTDAGIPYFQSATAGKICPADDLLDGMTGSLLAFGKTGSKMVVKVTLSGQAVSGS